MREKELPDLSEGPIIGQSQFFSFELLFLKTYATFGSYFLLPFEFFFLSLPFCNLQMY